MTNKTTREWFSELDEPFKSQAITNTQVSMLGMYIDEPIQDEYNSLAKCLNTSFTWSSTPEGFEYWRELYNELSLREEHQKRSEVLTEAGLI